MLARDRTPSPSHGLCPGLRRAGLRAVQGSAPFPDPRLSLAALPWPAPCPALRPSLARPISGGRVPGALAAGLG